MIAPTPLGQQFLAFAKQADATARFRLAPTPSGYLHAGNAFNFILTWLAARLHPGASILLRIDDLDADRKRPEYVQDVFDTLDWLGLDWNQGPRSPADFEKNWSQHLRLSVYQDLLAELRAQGLLFACAKSRRALAPFQGAYPLEFRNQGLHLDATDVAWRIKTPRDQPLPADFVVRRRDGIPAYQIASLADDLYFGSSHVIRGEDLFESTVAQQFLANCLGRTAFLNIQFFHHPLLTDEQGNKLSKSAGALALRTWRTAGKSPETLFAALAEWLGFLQTPVKNASDLVQNMRLLI